MQAGDDQNAVQHTKGKRADAAAFQHQLAEAVYAVLQGRPNQAKYQPQTDRYQPGGDGHKPSSSKKSQVLREFDVTESVVQRAAHQAADDPREHAHVDLWIKHLERGDHHQIADSARQPSGAVVVAGETDGDANGEDERQIGENRAARCVHDRDVQQVGITQAQQQAGNRQDGDGQHQGAAQPL